MSCTRTPRTTPGRPGAARGGSAGEEVGYRKGYGPPKLRTIHAPPDRHPPKGAPPLSRASLKYSLLLPAFRCASVLLCVLPPPRMALWQPRGGRHERTEPFSPLVTTAPAETNVLHQDTTHNPNLPTLGSAPRTTPTGQRRVRQAYCGRPLSPGPLQRGPPVGTNPRDDSTRREYVPSGRWSGISLTIAASSRPGRAGEPPMRALWPCPVDPARGTGPTSHRDDRPRLPPPQA